MDLQNFTLNMLPRPESAKTNRKERRDRLYKEQEDRKRPSVEVEKVKTKVFVKPLLQHKYRTVTLPDAFRDETLSPGARLDQETGLQYFLPQSRAASLAIL